MKREFTDDMREISGFGGEYEEACRAMVLAGLQWWEENPDADPRFKGYKGVYGILSEDNDDAKALTKATVAAADDCTGAMHQAAISHIMVARVRGWEAYKKEMIEMRAEEEENSNENL